MKKIFSLIAVLGFCMMMVSIICYGRHFAAEIGIAGTLVFLIGVIVLNYISKGIKSSIMLILVAIGMSIGYASSYLPHSRARIPLAVLSLMFFLCAIAFETKEFWLARKKKKPADSQPRK